MDLFKQIDELVVEALAAQYAFGQCSITCPEDHDCPEPNSEELTIRIMVVIADRLQGVTWETSVGEGEGSYRGAADWIRNRIK